MVDTSKTVRVTIELPDALAQSLEVLAKSRGQSMNEMFEELSAQMIAAYETKKHFKAMAVRGDPKKALETLRRLDAIDQSGKR